MKNYRKARLADYAGKEKGYISAAFFPEGSIERSDSIEINYAELPDSFAAPAHYHARSKTWVIVTKGAMYFKIGREPLTVAAGEFVVFEAGVAEEVVKVDPGTASFTIHSPSIPGGDKVLM